MEKRGTDEIVTSLVSFYIKYCRTDQEHMWNAVAARVRSWIPETFLAVLSLLALNKIDINCNMDVLYADKVEDFPKAVINTFWHNFFHHYCQLVIYNIYLIFSLEV